MPLTLGKYELLSPIGEGGFGVVYKARDPLLDRHVAVKVLHANLAAAPEFVERFRREARLAAALRHPNIVTVIEVGEQDGRYFIVMEYLDGRPLSALLKDGKPLPLQQAVALLRPLADALDYAHAKGMVHRDVKPGNILLAEGSRPVLTDFGLVKSTGEESTTTTGVALGTAEYMAPEQITGGEITSAADRYALGVLAYQLFTGRAPFTGKTPFEIQNGHVNKTPPHPGELNPLLGAQIPAALLKALAKDPAERFPTCAAFAQALAEGANREAEKLLEAEYARAERLMAERQYAAAREKWDALLAARPGYRDAESRRERAAQLLAWQEELERLLAEYQRWKEAAQALLGKAGELAGIERLQALLNPQETVRVETREVVKNAPPQMVEVRKVPGWVWLALVGVFVAGMLLPGVIFPPAKATATPYMPETVIVEREVVVTQEVVVQIESTKIVEVVKTVLVTVAAVTQPAATPAPAASGQNPPACTSIGQTWVSPQDGMTLVCVPAGDFLMGSADSDPDAYDDEKPQHSVYLDAYWIDRSEVTNAMFRQFVAATGYQTDAEREGWAYAYTGGGWEQVTGANWQHPQGPESSIAGIDDHPVVQVSWNDAAAYCEWAGRQLPTEAQWEKAARGADGWKYPWGDAAPVGSLLNFADINLAVDWADKTTDDGYPFTAPVGSYPAGASPYGALDMAGNVWEWVADWYDGSYYNSSPADNPSGPASGESRVLRGGSWDDVAGNVRAANRDWYNPVVRVDVIGFRCSR